MFKQDTIPDLIVKQIEDMVVSGKLKPNDQLPGEKEMAEQFGVGKSSVREALAALEYMNMIKRTKDGVFMNENVHQYANKELSFHLLLEKEHFLELIELREILECMLVKLAIKNASQEDLETIGAAMAVDPEDLETVIKGDVRFHIAIAETTQNKVLIQTYYKIRDVLDRVERKLSREKIDVVIAEHKAIYDAIVQKDEPRAVAAMRMHVNRRGKNISESLGR